MAETATGHVIRAAYQSESPAATGGGSLRGYGAADFDDAYSRMSLQLAVTVWMRSMAEEASSFGSYIHLPTDWGGMPALSLSDDRPVFLWQLLEVVDEQADYEQILLEWPDLSYGQIAAGMQFLRRLAQINTSGIDVDEILSEAMDSDQVIAVLEAHFGHGGFRHVLGRA